MYKVFVNNSPIILSTQKYISEEYISIPLRKANLNTIVKKMDADPSIKVHLFHKNEAKLYKLLEKKLPVVVAGGGKVYNKNNEILFIYRNGLWDLPKGKTEKKETIEQTALREVEEETGVEDLEITKFIMITYHTFKRNGVLKWKKTYWFEMYSEYTEILIPQTEEGITKVKWKSISKSKKALKKAYGTITQLFDFEYFN